MSIRSLFKDDKHKKEFFIYANKLEAYEELKVGKMIIKDGEIKMENGDEVKIEKKKEESCKGLENMCHIVDASIIDKLEPKEYNEIGSAIKKYGLIKEDVERIDKKFVDGDSIKYHDIFVHLLLKVKQLSQLCEIEEKIIEDKLRQMLPSITCDCDESIEEIKNDIDDLKAEIPLISLENKIDSLKQDLLELREDVDESKEKINKHIGKKLKIKKK